MQEVFLEMVTSQNNNKYYHMIERGDGMFDALYGRIGSTEAHASYSMSQWDKKYKEKVRKGYVDTTHLREKKQVHGQPDEYKPIPDEGIRALIEMLRNAAADTVKANYRIAASEVSKAMIREAQDVIDSLMSSRTISDFNNDLLQLFTVLPRKMNFVPDYLLSRDTPGEREKIIAREQRLLDVMSSQVKDDIPANASASAPLHDMTILEAFRLKLEPATDEDIALIKKELGECASMFYKAWRVTNEETEAAFQAHVKKAKITKRKRKLFWHGSRTENWWGILRTGLRLRPTNVITNGKMFGMGTYFAPKARKSVGHTSLSGSYWARGDSRYGFLALFDTAYGTPWVPAGRETSFGGMNYERLQKECPGADCLHAKAGTSYNGGVPLRNDEIIFYKECQMTIRYLVELKK